jgi:hypothetical protein
MAAKRPINPDKTERSASSGTGNVFPHIFIRSGELPNSLIFNSEIAYLQPQFIQNYAGHLIKCLVAIPRYMWGDQ